MSTTNTAPRTIHVHGAELSTDGESLGGYVETLALVVALVAVLASAWVVARPRADADLIQPAAPSPAVATFVRGPLDTADVIEPNVDASAATAVTSPLAVLTAADPTA